MGLGRSDEARREDKLYERLGTAERLNRELERIIVEARKGTFGFMIKAEETLQEGMDRNYAEFDDERSRLSKQIAILKEMIIQYQMAKFCWCDDCKAKRSMKEWRAKLKYELDALVVVKEGQKPPTGIQPIEEIEDEGGI